MVTQVLLKLTGLYFAEHPHHKLYANGPMAILKCWRCWITVTRSTLLCCAMAYVLMSNIFRTVRQSLIKETSSWNVEGTMFQGWMLQSLLSMIFTVYWQWSGAIRVIQKRVISYHPAHNSRETIRHDMRISLIFSFLATFFYVAYLASLLALAPTSGARYFVRIGNYGPEFWHYLARNVVSILGHFVWNLSFCYFVMLIRSITRELKYFNAQFKQMLDDSEKTSQSNPEGLANQLLLSLTSHNKLAEKIIEVDKIFQTYTFLMTAIATPQTIFALLLLIRRQTWLGLCYSVIELVLCMAHLIGLTVIPAQIYTEFRMVHIHLYWASSVWSKEFDLKVYQIVRLFTESVNHSDVGISLGGFILITKSLVLTCLSVIIPYVLLCVQMQFGSDQTLNFLIFAKNNATGNLTDVGSNKTHSG
ncbi:GUstatory Receptor family [Ditylenchus destructor]|uniref:GUstatory Receptor family n=1 Tax=Ditylenchus destructor TaxID=166010 RepID=A0AAD4MZH9_9BILA|nr:GUstatory Receptor family [Ditylenchus destructor]